MKRTVQMLCLLVATGWSLNSESHEVKTDWNLLAAKYANHEQLPLFKTNNKLVKSTHDMSQFKLSYWEGAHKELSKTDRLEPPHLASFSIKCKSCVEPGSNLSGFGKTTDAGKGVLITFAQAGGDLADYPFKPPQPEKTWRKPLGWTLVSVGGASIITGFVFHMVAWDTSSEAVSPVDKPGVDALIDDYTLAAIILYGSGAVIAASGLALLLWEEYAPFISHVVVSPKQASLAISGVF